MKIFYRLSDGSYPKVRFDNATKRNCLVNFLDKFMFHYGRDYYVTDELILVADNVKDETMTWIESLLKEYGVGRVETLRIMRTNAGSSAGSFRIVMEEALKLDDNEVVYFVEDDYAHLPNSRTVLMEGLDKSHYVTLYNHPDKYIPLQYLASRRDMAILTGWKKAVEARDCEFSDYTAIYLTSEEDWVPRKLLPIFLEDGPSQSPP